MTRSIVNAAPIDQNNDARITIDQNAVVIRYVSVLTAAIPGILKGHTGNPLNRLCHVRVMPLLNLFARYDLHIAARTVVRLFRDRVIKLIDRLLRLDDDIVNRIVLEILIVPCMCQVLSHTCAEKRYQNRQSKIPFFHKILPPC